MNLLRAFLWRTIRFGLRVLALLYVALALFGWFRAEKMIFQPQPASYHADLAGLRSIPAADGTPLAVFYLPNPAARYTVVYFHGNAEDIGDSLPQLRAFYAAGFAVLAFDYRGYGHSGGQPSEANVYADTQTVLAFARANLGVTPERCLVVGRSVGTGPAVELAAHTAVAGLVLISPFTSAFRVLTRVKLLPFDCFDNLAKIGDVHCPVLIFHGTADEVIPFTHGETIFAAMHEPKRHEWITGAGHNNIFDLAGGKIYREIGDFSKSLSPMEK